MENKVKSVTVAVAKTAPKSQKGKRGNQVGAPPKLVKLPRGNFTMDKVYALNPSICQLTCRKDVTSRVVGFRVAGTGKSKKNVKVAKSLKIVGKVPQPDGKVGRPSFKYGLVTASVTKTAKPVKTKSVPIANVTAKPVTVPVVITPAVTTPAVTTPVVTTPVV